MSVVGFRMNCDHPSGPLSIAESTGVMRKGVGERFSIHLLSVLLRGTNKEGKIQISSVIHHQDNDHNLEVSSIQSCYSTLRRDNHPCSGHLKFSLK